MHLVRLARPTHRVPPAAAKYGWLAKVSLGRALAAAARAAALAAVAERHRAAAVTNCTKAAYDAGKYYRPGAKPPGGTSNRTGPMAPPNDTACARMPGPASGTATADGHASVGNHECHPSHDEERQSPHSTGAMRHTVLNGKPCSLCSHHGACHDEKEHAMPEWHPMRPCGPCVRRPWPLPPCASPSWPFWLWHALSPFP